MNFFHEFEKILPNTFMLIPTEQYRSRIVEKLLTTVKAKIVSSLESCEKRANKPVIEDDNYDLARFFSAIVCLVAVVFKHKKLS